MSEALEADILRIINGLPQLSEQEVTCDFSLQDQNALLDAQGIKPMVDPSFKPVIGENVTFIVCVVIMSTKATKYLLIQEAKPSCAGKWYLPAGRMNKGEDICTAAKREVLEETGYEIECLSLISVETAKGNWIRFVLVGDVVGGNRKTQNEADSESIQAEWYEDLHGVQLRSKDIIPIIDLGMTYCDLADKGTRTKNDNVLPAVRQHEKLLLRLVIVSRDSTEKLSILLSERPSWHLPICEIHPGKSVYATLRQFMVQIFGADVPDHQPVCVLSVEMDGTQGHDGFCMTMLVKFKSVKSQVPILGKYVWHEPRNIDISKSVYRKQNKQMSIKLNVIN